MCHSDWPWYLPQPSNQSSRLIGWVVCQFTPMWYLLELPHLGKARAPAMDVGGYDFVFTCMHGLVLRRSPIKGDTLASVVSQSFTLELSITLVLGETSVLNYAWCVFPDQDSITLCLFAYLSVVKESDYSYLAITVMTTINLLPALTPGKCSLANQSLI